MAGSAACAGTDTQAKIQFFLAVSILFSLGLAFSLEVSPLAKNQIIFLCVVLCTAVGIPMVGGTDLLIL